MVEDGCVVHAYDHRAEYGRAGDPPQPASPGSRLAALRSLLALAEPELCRLCLKFPRLLLLSTADNVEPTLASLRSALELSDAEARTLVLRSPQVLSLSVEANLLPSLAALRRMLALDDAELRRLVLRVPAILGLSSTSNLGPKLAWLRDELRLTKAECGALVLRDPAVLGASLALCKLRRRRARGEPRRRLLLGLGVGPALLQLRLHRMMSQASQPGMAWTAAFFVLYGSFASVPLKSSQMRPGSPCATFTRLKAMTSIVFRQPLSYAAT